MLHRDANLNSIGDLARLLEKRDDGSQPLWFRGQSSKTWKLQPSISRSVAASSAELALVKRFKQNALTFLTRRPSTEWEWLFQMQHYGVPTRLLDWTESPLVGLYFAVNEAKHHDKDGALWCLLPKVLNKNAGYDPAHAMELPFVGVEEELESYLPEIVAKEHKSNMQPMALSAVRDSPRMYAQLGVFTITHRETLAIEKVGEKKHIFRFIIPRGKKKGLLKALEHLSINKLTLFPELTSVACVAAEII